MASLYRLEAVLTTPVFMGRPKKPTLTLCVFGEVRTLPNNHFSRQSIDSLSDTSRVETHSRAGFDGWLNSSRPIL